MVSFPMPRVVALSLVVALVAACDSSEERAQKHLARGTELIEAGDVQRGLVELRNVFVLDSNNTEARMIYARAARSIGNIPESYSNFLWVADRDPQNTEAKLALTQLAIETGNWDEAERHGAALTQANAELEGVESAKLALEFRRAMLAEDTARLRELTAEAERLFASNRQDDILQRLLIEGYSRENRLDAALEIVEIALAQQPDDRRLYLVRAQLLGRKGDTSAVEKHLRDIIARFPDDEETKGILIRQLATQGRLDDAEQFLRENVATSDSPRDAHVVLITFLRQARGAEAALAELNAAVDAYEDNQILRALRAGIQYDLGQRDAAVTALEEVVRDAEPGDDLNRYKVSLAKMLEGTGNEVGARQTIEEVLAADPSQGAALKMSARWYIDADKPEDALRVLRLVLDREPEDAAAMTLMAEAHQRNGNPELAQDLLALAVEASNNAPAESLRFAKTLYDQKRYRPAEDVLIKALRRVPGNTDILVLLGKIYVATEDWGRAEQVEATLRRQNDQRGTLRADELRLQIFGQREGRDRAVAYLEELLSTDDSQTATVIALIRARVAEKDYDEALQLAEKLVADHPDNPRAKMVLGNTHFAARNFDEAERVLREAMATDTGSQSALQLVRVLGAQARVDDAMATLDTALSRLPDDADLLWSKASLLEQTFDIDGAIGIYEKLYEKDTGSLIVANNLASLLATYREDDASLERAFSVARRLKGTQVPPFQDTYGWILFRRGDHEEALEYLEPAAERLVRDPIVQFHLAKAYQALGRQDDAAAAFQRAIDVASEDDSRPQIQEARAALGAAPVATETK